MKADHRKELQTNLLADRMGRLVQGIKAGPQSSSAFAWVLGGLTLVAVVGWYWAGSHGARQSEDWVRLLNDSNRDPRGYAEIARQSPGTLPARTARFQQARSLLNLGLTTFYFPGSHGQAVKNLNDAGKAYRELLGECQGNAILEQEALLGAAKVEETLSSTPNPDNSDVKLGSLDKALTFYQRLADNYPDSFEGKQAQKRVEELKDSATRSRIEEFYAKLSDNLKKQGDFSHPDLGGQAPPPASTP